MEISHVRWVLSGSSEVDSVLAYAGDELARYVHKLIGAKWDVRGLSKVGGRANTAWLGVCEHMPAPPYGTLTPAPWDDGFAIWTVEDELFIAGRNARSVLFGVYDFLEEQGVRFTRPGPDGEVIPRIEYIKVPGAAPSAGVAPRTGAAIVEDARYRHRGVCIEGAPSLEHALGMIDWCAKKKMNTVFLQFLSSRYFYNLWYERKYNPEYADYPLTEEEALAYDDQVIAAMKKRGMVLHRVGHGWTSAAFEMPRSGWVESDEEVKPEYVPWLAEVDGERRLFKNIPINTELCYSYQPAFDGFVETIVRYCEAHSEKGLDVVHVWLSDAVDNKCECDECRGLSISDWYAKIINALSEALHRRVPKMRFVFLCYIELLWPPEQVAIDETYPNAILMFAPITRCYGHALTDPACDDGQEWPRPPLNQFAVSRQNAFFVKRLADWRQVFKGDSFDFDYHLMWANWRQLTDTAIARIYHEDLQQLEGLGLNGLLSCQTFRAFYPSGLAMAILADSLWNPDVPWDEARQRYLEGAFGEHTAFADDYLEKVESFLDTGDLHRREPPLSNADEEKLAACAAFLDASLAELNARQESLSDRAQSRSLDLLSHHAQFLRFITEAHRARLAGKPEEASEKLARAADFLRQTEPQYSAFIDTMLALRLSVE
jgi:hypothetical protein